MASSPTGSPTGSPTRTGSAGPGRAGPGPERADDAAEGSTPAEVAHHAVAIIGAGFAGVGLAHLLMRSGRDDVVVLERGPEVGGTWRDNTYPGAQCDVPAHLYSYSFAPNPNWTRTYADGDEIQQYLRNCADRFGVRPRLRLNTTVTGVRWDPHGQRWRIATTGCEGDGSLSASVVVVATGLLSEPSVPELDGLATFAGETFHSGAWRHDVDLAGKRVAVVGTGASVVQFVPAIAPVAGHLSVFQRTPPWVVPRSNPPISARRRAWYRRIPALQQLARAKTFWARELYALALTRRTRWLERGEQLARRHLADQVPDPALRALCTPDYAFGCKRVLLSDDWYPTLARPDVDLVPHAVRSVTPTGVVDDTGCHHDADVLIFGTGFAVTTHPMFDAIVGPDGTSLGAQWRSEGMAAHLGTEVSGLPNLFVVTGPNTGVGHTSMVFMMEAQFAYILDALDTMDRLGVTTAEVRSSIQEASNAALAQRMDSTVWTTGGCGSWYLDAAGRNTTLWPGTAWSFHRRLRHWVPGDHLLGFGPNLDPTGVEPGVATAAGTGVAQPGGVADDAACATADSYNRRIDPP